MGIGSLLNKMCVQTAVYWGSPVNDGYGKYTFASAVEISCRWEDRNETIVDATGKERMSRSIVYVTQDVEIGGMMYLGELDDLNSNPSAYDSDVAGACFEIIRFDKIPSLGSTNDFLRKVYLSDKIT